ncbi:TonB-dependent receptor [Hyphococcus sp. DH-69]|uniref:TonB-dependent receptor n=1 Tax=Hyphococcus formosus TaxID=3143534 RepID=UPI00398BB8DF
MRNSNLRAIALAPLYLFATPVIAADANTDFDDSDVITVYGEQTLDFNPEVASRLGLSNRETPAIVDVVSQQSLQRQGARNAIEAMNSVPGVASGNLPGSVGSVSMRGFHRAINYLYDGVRQPNSDAGNRNYDAFMFERIEVIKGPASVLSGEGALAGAINFVPRQPHIGETSGEILASYGSRDTARIAGDLNVSLNNAAAFRGSLSYGRSDGWVEDTGSDKLAGRFAVLLKPLDDLSVTLSVDYIEDDFSTAYYGTPVVSPEIALNPSNAVSGSAGLVLDRAMRNINFNVTDGDMGSETLWLRSRMNYAISESWSIVSDTSYYDSDRRWRDADEYTFNASSGLIDRYATHITHDHQYWNQRLHLNYDGELFGHHNRFTAGFEIGETDFFTLRRFGSVPSVDPFNPVRGTFPEENASNFSYRQDVTADVTSKAFFVENAFNLTPELLLVGGARLDDFELDREVLDIGTGDIDQYSRDYDPITWRLGAVYSVVPETQVFALFTNAASPVTGLFFLSSSRASFDVTTGRSFEVGVKSSLIDNQLHLTASLFHIRQDDILTRDPIDPSLTIQGGEQTSKGAELALSWTPNEEWTVSLGGTLLNTTFEGLIERGGADRSGNRPANTPERLADLVITYAPKTLPVSITGIVRHNGDFYTANDNAVKVEGFTVLDAAISWDASFGVVSLRGRNLTDTFYADWSGYSSGLVFIGEPRGAEVSFSRHF